MDCYIKKLGESGKGQQDQRRAKGVCDMAAVRISGGEVSLTLRGSGKGDS